MVDIIENTANYHSEARICVWFKGSIDGFERLMKDMFIRS